jgi:mono/diheme cytochrome c family protein
VSARSLAALLLVGLVGAAGAAEDAPRAGPTASAAASSTAPPPPPTFPVARPGIVAAGGIAPSASGPAAAPADHGTARGSPRAPYRGNPYRGHPGQIARGKALFVAMHCDGCHSPGAVGGAGPSLMDGRWRHGGTAAEIYASIHGGQSGGMPAFGGLLSPEALWQLTAYLQSLTPARDPATTVYAPRRRPP